MTVMGEVSMSSAESAFPRLVDLMWTLRGIRSLVENSEVAAEVAMVLLGELPAD